MRGRHKRRSTLRLYYTLVDGGGEERLNDELLSAFLASVCGNFEGHARWIRDVNRTAH